jgi:hypothetical protein
MKLSLKFNVIFVAVFAVGLTIATMLETAMAMQNYISKQIARLVKAQDSDLEASWIME